MLYRFGDFELDLDRVELRARGERVPLEPQVFALLALLIDARDRLVTKDEIFEKIWEGRIVTDAALASRVKSARQALGDNWTGAAVHPHRARARFPFCRGRADRGAGGVVGPFVNSGAGGAGFGAAPPGADVATQPSIAVLPFGSRALRATPTRRRWPRPCRTS